MPNDHTQRNFPCEIFDISKYQPIKGDNYHLLKHTCRVHLLNNRLCNAWIASIDIIALAIFRLNIDLLAPIEKRENFAEGGNYLTLRPATRKTSCGIQRAKIREM